MNADRFTDKRWQLQNGDESNSQWKLLDSEQELDERWQLEPGESEYIPYRGREWQPVEYVVVERSGGNWVLPSLVLVAVLAVVGYMVWIGFNNLGISQIVADAGLGDWLPSTVAPVASNDAAQATGGEQTTDTSQPAPATGAEIGTTAEQPVDPANTPAQPVADAPAPTPQPPATEPPAPTATPSPMMVERRVATVREQYGVNARRQSGGVGDIATVVPQNTQMEIFAQEENADGQWLQVALPDQTLAWVAGKYVDIAVSSVSLDEMNRMRAQVGLPLTPTPGAPPPQSDAVTAPAVAPVAPADSALTTTNTLSPTASVPAAVVTALVVSQSGINIRQEPNQAAVQVTLVQSNTTLSVVGRTIDSQWLQLSLEDGRTGWASSQFLTVSGDLNSVPVVVANAAIDSAPAVSTTAAISTTATPTSTTPAATQTTTTTQGVPGAPITAKIVALSGANARSGPNKDAEKLIALPFGAITPVNGRTADNSYLQITLEDSRPAWILANTAELSAPLESLTVIQ